MGPIYQIVKRPPLERMLAAWLSPAERVRFTCSGDDVPVGAKKIGSEKWEAEVSVRSLHKLYDVTFADRSGETVPVWFTGWLHFRSWGGAVAGCIAPRDRDSWISLFASPDELDAQKELPDIDDDEESWVVRRCMEEAQRLSGSPLLGAEISQLALNLMKQSETP